MTLLVGGLSALVILTLVVISAGQAKNTGQAWHEPLTKLVAKVSVWFLNSPERESLLAQRELWRAEDAEYEGEYARTKDYTALRKKLLEERQIQLTARTAKQTLASGYTVGSMVTFLICLLALVPIQAASYYLKVQTARAFLVGSRNLMGLKLTILGFPLVLHTVEVVTVGLMLLEIISGVVLSQAHDRLRQVKNEGLQESARRYQVQSQIAWALIVILVLTEAALGFWRGSMETKDSVFGILIMLVLSATIPSMTILVSYVLKGQLSQVAGPLGFFFRLVGLAVLSLVAGPLVMVAWLILVGLGLFIRVQPVDRLD